jgi:phosphatidylserine decarboxylase
MQIFLTKLFKLSSYLVGKFCQIRLPVALRYVLYHIFIWKYRINTQDFSQPLSSFPNFDSFFTRSLTPHLRPIDFDSQYLTSPVDALIQYFGTINNNEMFQVKNIKLSLNSLFPFPPVKHFLNGHYLTLYLSPKDCHRIFSPLSSDIIATYHLPGHLYPVCEPYISKQPIYNVNERFITLFKTQHSYLALIMVGALNVGSMTVEYDQNFLATHKNSEVNYAPPISIKKGAWLGTFHLGSTVILLFPKNTIKFLIQPKQTVNYGQAIAQFL